MSSLQDLLASAAAAHHVTSFVNDTDEVVPDMDDMDLAKFESMVPDPVNPTNLSAMSSGGMDMGATQAGMGGVKAPR
jgi:hypothetical protein